MTTGATEQLSSPESVQDKTLDEVPTDPDSATTDELDDLEDVAKRAAIKGTLQDIDERKKYAHCIFCLTVGWLGLMGYVLLAQGYNFKFFELHDSVLIALVTTTTSGIVGLLVLVVKYLFPSR